MISPTDQQAAKSVSIVSYLQNRGFQPVSSSGNELLYFSPLRTENTPSFRVNPAKNLFKDWGVDTFRGDVIRLCELLEKIPFPEAVRRLLTHTGQDQVPFSFCCQTLPNQPSTPVQALTNVLSVRELTSAALLAYLAGRGISPAVAGRYCREVHYHVKGRTYYAVGFPNDSGGYALRSARYKGQTPPAGVSTVPVPGSTSASLFEGFFDFLSACQCYGLPTKTAVILNSTSNLSRALPLLQSFDRIDTYLDRDEAGRKALDRLQREGIALVDRSDVYAPRKDFNEYLIRSNYNPHP